MGVYKDQGFAVLACLSFGNTEIKKELFVQASHSLCQSQLLGWNQRSQRHVGSFVVHACSACVQSRLID